MLRFMVNSCFWFCFVFRSGYVPHRNPKGRRRGKERKGKRRKGKEREGKERKGKERKGKEKEKERIGKGIVTIV